MTAALDEELTILNETVEKLNATIADPFSSVSDVEYAKELLPAATQRVADNLNKRQAVETKLDGRVVRTAPNLLPTEERIPGAGVVVNTAGYGEPDLVNSDPEHPVSDRVLEPDLIDELRRATGMDTLDDLTAGAGLDLTPATDTELAEEYRKCEAIGRQLGLDAITVAQLWSQLEAKGFGRTLTGTFALRLFIENRFLLLEIRKLSDVALFAMGKLTNLHKPEEKPPNKPEEKPRRTRTKK